MPTQPHTRALALRLFDELGREVLGESLTARGWTFGFDRARRRLGVCRPRDKRITLSAHLSRTLPEAEVEDTVRHEVAHALDHELNPSRRGRRAHDATWRALARRCGAAPERCFTGDVPTDPTAPYAAACPSCGASRDLYRQPVRAHLCPTCSRPSRPAYLRVTHRPTGRVVWRGGAERGEYGGTAGVTATCPRCGETVRRARRPTRKTACAPCCRRYAGGRYDDRFRLRFNRPGP